MYNRNKDKNSTLLDKLNKERYRMKLIKNTYLYISILFTLSSWAMDQDLMQQLQESSIFSSSEDPIASSILQPKIKDFAFFDFYKSYYENDRDSAQQAVNQLLTNKNIRYTATIQSFLQPSSNVSIDRVKESINREYLHKNPDDLSNIVHYFINLVKTEKNERAKNDAISILDALKQQEQCNMICQITIDNYIKRLQKNEFNDVSAEIILNSYDISKYPLQISSSPAIPTNPILEAERKKMQDLQRLKKMSFKLLEEDLNSLVRNRDKRSVIDTIQSTIDQIIYFIKEYDYSEGTRIKNLNAIKDRLREIKQSSNIEEEIKEIQEVKETTRNLIILNKGKEDEQQYYTSEFKRWRELLDAIIKETIERIEQNVVAHPEDFQASSIGVQARMTQSIKEKEEQSQRAQNIWSDNTDDRITYIKARNWDDATKIFILHVLLWDAHKSYKKKEDTIHQIKLSQAISELEQRPKDFSSFKNLSKKERKQLNAFWDKKTFKIVANKGEKEKPSSEYIQLFLEKDADQIIQDKMNGADPKLKEFIKSFINEQKNIEIINPYLRLKTYYDQIQEKKSFLKSDLFKELSAKAALFRQEHSPSLIKKLSQTIGLSVNEKVQFLNKAFGTPHEKIDQDKIKEGLEAINEEREKILQQSDDKGNKKTKDQINASIQQTQEKIDTIIEQELQKINAIKGSTDLNILNNALEKIQDFKKYVSEINFELIRKLEQAENAIKELINPLPRLAKESKEVISKQKIANDYFIAVLKLINKYDETMDEENINQAIKLFQDNMREVILVSGLFSPIKWIHSFIWGNYKYDVPIEENIEPYRKKSDKTIDTEKLKQDLINAYFKKYPNDLCASTVLLLNNIPSNENLVKKDIKKMLLLLQEKKQIYPKNFNALEKILLIGLWNEEKMGAFILIFNDVCNLLKSSDLTDSQTQEIKLAIESLNNAKDASSIDVLIKKINDIYNNPLKPSKEEPKEKLEANKPTKESPIIELAETLTPKENKPDLDFRSTKKPTTEEPTRNVLPAKPDLSSLKEEPLSAERRQTPSAERRQTPSIEPLKVKTTIPTAKIEATEEQSKLKQPKISPEDEEAKELLDKWIGISKSDKQSDLVFNQLTEEKRKIKKYLNNKTDRTQDIQDALQAINSEYIQKTPPNQIGSFIIEPIQKGAIIIKNVSLKELNAYENQINMYTKSGKLTDENKQNAKVALNLVNAKRRELMSSSLLATKMEELSLKVIKSEEKQQLEVSLLRALDTSALNLYQIDKKEFTRDSRSFIESIIKIGENIAKIDNQDYYAPYILALGTHPFLDTDEIAQDNSLMFADESLFNFTTQSGRTISFDLFKKSCAQIAQCFVGFPVPRRKPVVIEESKRDNLTIEQGQETIEAPDVPTTKIEATEDKSKLKEPQISLEDEKAKQLLDQWISQSATSGSSGLSFGTLTQQEKIIEDYLGKNIGIEQTEDIKAALKKIKIELIRTTPLDQVKGAIFPILTKEEIDKDKTMMDNLSLDELKAYTALVTTYRDLQGKKSSERQEANEVLKNLLLTSLRREQDLLPDNNDRSTQLEKVFLNVLKNTLLSKTENDLYQNIKTAQFSEDTKQLMKNIITLSDLVDTIESIQNYSQYFMMIAEHPFLSEEQDTPSLMRIHPTVFSYDVNGVEYPFQKFKEACQKIASKITGFPIPKQDQQEQIVYADPTTGATDSRDRAGIPQFVVKSGQSQDTSRISAGSTPGGATPKPKANVKKGGSNSFQLTPQKPTSQPTKLEKKSEIPVATLHLHHEPERNLAKEQEQFKQELENDFLSNHLISKQLKNIAFPLYTIYQIPFDADFTNIKDRQKMIEGVNNISNGITEYVKIHGSPVETALHGLPVETALKDYIDSIAQHPLLIALTNNNPNTKVSYSQWKNSFGEGNIPFKLSCTTIHQYFPSFPTVPAWEKSEEETPMPSKEEGLTSFEIEKPQVQQAISQLSADAILRLIEEPRRVELQPSIAIGPTSSFDIHQNIPTQPQPELPVKTPEEQPAGGLLSGLTNFFARIGNAIWNGIRRLFGY